MSSSVMSWKRIGIRIRTIRSVWHTYGLSSWRPGWRVATRGQVYSLAISTGSSILKGSTTGRWSLMGTYPTTAGFADHGGGDKSAGKPFVGIEKWGGAEKLLYICVRPLILFTSFGRRLSLISRTAVICYLTILQNVLFVPLRPNVRTPCTSAATRGWDCYRIP